MRIRMRSLQLGCLGLDHELVVFPHPDLVLNVNRRTGQKHWLRGPVLSYVIEHPAGLLLWDTGVSTAWPTEWLEPWQQLIDLTEITPAVCLLSRLKQEGLGPDHFRYVVQSHLHADHAGGLRVFQDAGAEIIVHEAEYRYVENLREPQRFWIPAGLQPAPRHKTAHSGERRRGADAGRAADPHAWTHPRVDGLARRARSHRICPARRRRPLHPRELRPAARGQPDESRRQWRSQQKLQQQRRDLAFLNAPAHG
jgi:hypothetical protein